MENQLKLYHRKTKEWIKYYKIYLKGIRIYVYTDIWNEIKILKWKWFVNLENDWETSRKYTHPSFERIEISQFCFLFNSSCGRKRTSGRVFPVLWDLFDETLWSTSTWMYKYINDWPWLTCARAQSKSSIAY